MPLEAAPALPAWPSVLARTIRAGEAGHGGCVTDRELLSYASLSARVSISGSSTASAVQNMPPSRER
jgi:hypothetical protein